MYREFSLQDTIIDSTLSKVYLRDYSSDDVVLLLTNLNDFKKYIVLKAGVINDYRFVFPGGNRLILSAINNLDAVVRIEMITSI
ncbi:MAG: hypothetical protein Q4E02_02130 [Lagierella massiliensis]|nr:hypothetical protein [Lagierella massiliensis]